MKFTMRVRKTTTGEEWDETQERNVRPPTPEGAERWARKTVAAFNATLRKFESPRELVRVTVQDTTSVRQHAREKVNLFTIVPPRGAAHDVYRCRNCGITGKRVWLDRDVKRDPKYADKRYDRCDTSRKAMKGKRP